jgi:SAM-dependent methyltransferase
VSKRQVYEFWNRAACGEELYLAGLDRAAYERQARRRYELEPYIAEFARFEEARGLRVLEIGVGLGADHERFAEAGAELYGIDLTPRAIEHTRRRLMLFDLTSRLAVGDAEALCFPDERFDLVYSWGVLHHTPEGGRRGVAGAETRWMCPHHAVPQVEPCGPHALDTLCVARPATLVEPEASLCRRFSQGRIKVVYVEQEGRIVVITVMWEEVNL